MILWPKAKRSISPATARQIAAVARRHGANPVAVFVDEDAATICRVCDEADVQIAQLHGDGARAAVSELHADLRVVYVMHAQKDGTLCTPLPQQLDRWGLGCFSGCAFYPAVPSRYS
jgi:phosphoribosylanthranilate isomerase